MGLFIFKVFVPQKSLLWDYRPDAGESPSGGAQRSDRRCGQLVRLVGVHAGPDGGHDGDNDANNSEIFHAVCILMFDIMFSVQR